MKAWVRVRWVELGGGAEAKIKLFQNMDMLHIKLKLKTLAATWWQIFCLTKGVGSKDQTIYFSESSHVAYQIKADEAGSNMVIFTFHQSYYI